MIRALETAIKKIETLPEEQQAYAARLLEQIADQGTEPYRLSELERSLVQEGIADIEAGRVIQGAELEAFWNRNRK